MIDHGEVNCRFAGWKIDDDPGEVFGSESFGREQVDGQRTHLKDFKAK